MATKRQIRFLGTGTSQGVPVIGCECEVCQSSDARDKRLRCAALVEIQGKNIAIDIGPDFRQQMLREDITHLDAILITHEHNDHIIGLDDVRPFNFRSGKDMPVYASERVCNEIKGRFPYVFIKSPYPGAPEVSLKTVEAGKPFQLDNIDVLPILIDHGTIDILGYKIDDMAYLTDVHKVPEESILHLKNLKTLVISALHRTPHHSHQTLEQALQVIKRLQPQQSYLIHMGHGMGLHAEVMKELPANVQMAYDGLHVPF